MNDLWVLKMKIQSIYKFAELNECVNTGFAARASPRHSGTRESNDE